MYLHRTLQAVYSSISSSYSKIDLALSLAFFNHFCIIVSVARKDDLAKIITSRDVEISSY